MSKILENRTAYKPFQYPWAYEAYKKQQQMHWMPEEVPMAEDKRDWDKKLTPAEKNLLTQIFRFFTQADIDVAGGYIDKFMPLFKHPELRMMMSSFAAMEAVHIDAYSTLIETVGMPESEYNAFLQFKEMKDKHDYLGNFNIIEVTEYGHTPETLLPSVLIKIQNRSAETKALAKQLAVYSAFTEGLQLFSSFVILLNFTRFGKMKGMGQIVTWSIRDESLHVESMIKLFNTLIEESPYIWVDNFKKELYDICRTMVELEDKFIDLAFKEGGIEGLTADEVKQFVRYIADRRLLQLGLKPNFGVKKNPLPWYDELLNSVEHTNFFEGRVTEYNKGSIEDDWDGAFV
jgi:ribonucleoside-diphosphate reductase beta chain